MKNIKLRTFRNWELGDQAVLFFNKIKCAQHKTFQD